MADLPVFTLADLERQPPFDPAAFSTDDAVDLGMLAVGLTRERGVNLAVRIMLRADTVFLAKLGTTGPDNDEWLAGKSAVAERFGVPSLLVRRRREQEGQPGEIDEREPLLRYSGGSLPIRVGGELVGTLTVSGEPDVIDHEVASEAIRRFLAR